ncbi:BCS1 N terminal-domain-containing protein [Nemania serpens]|nr:BCS1 N terminal-domain-containing protein [Nemania serpens]
MADPLISPFRTCEPQHGHDAASPTTMPPQLALLDLLFPGFSIFAGVVQRSLHIDLNLYIPLLLLVGMLMMCWNYVSLYFWAKMRAYFMSVVDIRTDDEIYNILMSWVASQRFSQDARKFIVNTNLASRSWYVWRDEDDGDEDEGRYHQSAEKRNRKGLSYTPSFGSHYFWYRGRLLLFRRTANREQNSFMLVSEREEISISCFGRNPWILKELLLEAREQYMEKDKQKTQIYRGVLGTATSTPSWQRCMSRASRPFSTVILDEKTKKELVDDATDYLDPNTQRWYANRGIPYRRGYLLHGPPGTGKSSLSFALAGFFKMRIYIVSLSSAQATEEILGNLFAELPRQCVVLLEDIDSAGLTHTRERPEVSTSPSLADNDNTEPQKGTRENGNTNTNTGNTNTNNRLSLSGLLNILDGVASQEGRILIMTTNHVEQLDKALIRPGRIDMIVEFGLADDCMTTNIFRNIFASLEGDDNPKAERYLAPSPDRKAAQDKREKERAAHDAMVDKLANAFAAKIPAHEFSPAELQGHLVRHKHSPQHAVDAAEEFVEKTRKEHREKEIKAAEEKRKAEQEKEEQAKKKAVNEAENNLEERIRKKVEGEIKKKLGDKIKKKVETEMKKSEKEGTSKKLKTGSPDADSDLSSVDTDTSSDIENEAAGEKIRASIGTGVHVNEKGHARKDSGYVTPLSGEP